MPTEQQTRKLEAIARILKQDTYTPDSGVYQQVADQLAKLPAQVIHNLDLLIVFKIKESNELACKVQDILRK